MSTYNFGNQLSEMFGAALMPVFGIEKGKMDGLVSLLLLRALCTLVPLALIMPLLGTVEHHDEARK